MVCEQQGKLEYRALTFHRRVSRSLDWTSSAVTDPISQIHPFPGRRRPRRSPFRHSARRSPVPPLPLSHMVLLHGGSGACDGDRRIRFSHLVEPGQPILGAVVRGPGKLFRDGDCLSSRKLTTAVLLHRRRSGFLLCRDLLPGLGHDQRLRTTVRPDASETCPLDLHRL